MTIDYSRIKAHPTMYNGIRFRSRLEATWAAFFDALGWRWEYEPFDLKGWVPDFLIYGANRDALVEVKPITKISDHFDVVNKISDSAGRGYYLLLCEIAPIYEKDYSLTQIFSSCECGDVRCMWQYRFIAKVNGRYDLVFGHWPYSAFTTGSVIPSDETQYDPYQGDLIFELWGKAKNKTQWMVSQ